MKTKTISKMMMVATAVAMSASSLLAQTNIGSECGCPSVGNRGTIIPMSTLPGVSNGELTTDLTLDCHHLYQIDQKIYVANGVTLTVQPGTVIKGKYVGKGSPNATALVVETGGKIIADGTATCPIIFTAEADQLDGKYPVANVGQWGGVVLLGKSFVNLTVAANTSNATTTRYCAGTDGVGFIEGFDASVAVNGHAVNLYGGGSAPLYHDNSGILRYVSIRYAGDVLPVVAGTASDGSNELNGLSLGAVGDGTTIEHLEVVSAADDNIEFFGGTVNVKYINTLFGADDMFDFDLGYRGKAQFYFGAKTSTGTNDTLTTNTADNGIEADADDDGAHPTFTWTASDAPELGAISSRSHPIFSNITMIGNGRQIAHADNTGMAAIQGKELTELEVYNSVFSNFRSGLHLATARSTAGSAAKQGGDAYDNWTNQTTAFQSVDGFQSGQYAIQGSLKAKNNTFIACTYPLTKGALCSGKWATGPIITNFPGSTRQYSSEKSLNGTGSIQDDNAGSATKLTNITSGADYDQFVTTDKNAILASASGFVFNWDMDVEAATPVNAISTKLDPCPTPALGTVASFTATPALNNAFFTATTYRGAFANDRQDWLSGWSYTSILKATNGIVTTQNNRADINQDGKVDASDFSIMLGRFNKPLE